MNLPHSTYDYQPKNKPCDEPHLIERIEKIIEEYPGYGYRRVTRELHRRGYPIHHKKVLHIMKQRGLTRKLRHRWVRTTDSNHSHRVYPNLVQNLLVTGPNQVWVSDLTYIGIQSGFVYLAVILDLFARRAVGHALFATSPRPSAWRLFGWPLRCATPRRGSSTTPTGASSMPPTITWTLCCSTASGSACPGRETRTTTRPLRASSKP
jgi:hypothetical protein